MVAAEQLGVTSTCSHLQTGFPLSSRAAKLPSEWSPAAGLGQPGAQEKHVGTGRRGERRGRAPSYTSAGVWEGRSPHAVSSSVEPGGAPGAQGSGWGSVSREAGPHQPGKEAPVAAAAAGECAPHSLQCHYTGPLRGLLVTPAGLGGALSLQKGLDGTSGSAYTVWLGWEERSQSPTRLWNLLVRPTLLAGRSRGLAQA